MDPDYFYPLLFLIEVIEWTQGITLLVVCYTAK